MEDRYKVFCFTHVDTQCFKDPLYTLLHTGQAYDGKRFENIQGDDTGDNISIRKGETDGFITGLYWIWKNTNYEITGVASYRGYISYNGKTPISLEETRMLFEERQIDFIALRYEWDLPMRDAYRQVYRGFYYEFLHDPFLYLREAVADVDAGYLKAFDYVYHSNIINMRHTFITRRNYFVRYCEWLFAVIDRFEEIARERHYEIPPMRTIGYLAEFLERIWILNNSMNVLELPHIFVTERDKGYAGAEANR